MKLHNQNEKNAFLQECLEYINRIEKGGIQTPATQNIAHYKVLVLKTIFITVGEMDVSENTIDLNSVYKDVKNQLKERELSELPVPDVILKALGSFDRTCSIDAVMKSHRYVPFNSPLGYCLNLFREPLSTAFLKKTGFFSLDNKKTLVNNNPVPDELKSTHVCK